jgi:hypothetical protein
MAITGVGPTNALIRNRAMLDLYSDEQIIEDRNLDIAMKGKSPESPSKWTNASVLLLSGDRDPVAVITEKARATVLTALDNGWTGPPFDPIALADLLKLEVVPTETVRDARTVPLGKGGVRIEFNPSRPRGRMRYSLAHEIAHTFFPDCAERARERAPHGQSEGDDWQLEALCNIAAAELLMPFGSLSSLATARPDIDLLLADQRRFDVSTEALFIRAARGSEEACAMFCASRTGEEQESRQYRLDYVIGSHAWSSPVVRRGTTLPANSVVADCSAIGFTARADESWGPDDGSAQLHLECVGIPPYPSQRIPRVIGMLWQAGADTLDPNPSISYVRGDATLPRGDGPKMIVQVVNDSTPNWGGSGFASALRTRFPQTQSDFKDWWEKHPSGKARLGETRVVHGEGAIWSASIVAQRGYGPSTSPRIRYSALQSGLEYVTRMAKECGATVHMPRIGCGQAGGSWHVVEGLIRETLAAAGVHTIVYDPPEPTKAFSSSSDRVSEQSSLPL